MIFDLKYLIMEITKEMLKEIVYNAIKASGKDSYRKIQLNADENSFYNAYAENALFAERAEQIKSRFDLIEESNKKIFDKYEIDYSKTDEWFANIIAGYQLGAFIDIDLEGVKITYYYDGAEWKEEFIKFTF